MFKVVFFWRFQSLFLSVVQRVDSKVGRREIVSASAVIFDMWVTHSTM